LQVVTLSCLALAAHGFAPATPYAGVGSPLRWGAGGAVQSSLRATRTVQGAKRGMLGVRCQNDDSKTPHKSASVTGKGTRVCIVGGGFGGLYTAMQLAQLLPLQPEGERAKITLVDSGERFIPTDAL